MIRAYNAKVVNKSITRNNEWGVAYKKLETNQSLAFLKHVGNKILEFFFDKSFFNSVAIL